MIAILAAVSIFWPICVEAKARLAFIPDDISDFSNLAMKGCEAAAEKSQAFDCLAAAPKSFSALEQISIISDLQRNKIDGLAIYPSDPNALEPKLKELESAGIPVVTWGADLAPDLRKLRRAHVGPNEYQVGVGLAQLLRDLRPKGGRICLFTGPPGLTAFVDRLHGFRDTLSENKTSLPEGEKLSNSSAWHEVTACPISAASPEDATNRLGEVLATPDTQVIIFLSSLMQFSPYYASAVSSILGKIKNQETTLIGVGASQLQITNMNAGYSSGQVGVDPFELGYTATLSLFDIATGKNVAEQIDTALEVCAPEYRSCRNQLVCPDHEPKCKDGTCDSKNCK